MSHTSRRRQQGSVIITVCLLTLFLLGFIGFALDFGRLFIVKTELQTAIDACALAAAQELDSMPTAIDRARSAGMTAGNLNAVNLQSANWSGKGQLLSTEITFKNGAYNDTTDPLVAQYAQCQHVQPAVQLWLLQAMGAFSGNKSLFTNTHDVWANAVATRASSQTSCPIPVAVKPKTGGTKANNYGYTAGEWIPLLMGAGEATNGQIGWVNLDGSNDAAETVAEMNGKCGIQIGDDLGTPGVQAAVADVWNYRFGIYRQNVSPATPTTHNPDYSGYAYTDTNWPPDPASVNPQVRNAYSGTPYSDPTGTAENFATKRTQFASCDDDGTRMRGGPSHSCESITGLDLNSFNDLATPGPTAVGGHKDHGRDRRTVLVPVQEFVGGSWTITDWTCMLMLQPLSIPMVQVELEFIGLAGAPGVPCASSGMPGGWAGPLVPQLVR
jgi:Flp pilus assembly protein TadG